MAIRWWFCLYDRPFRDPLHTSHGVWNSRSGVLLRMVSADGKLGFGEISPLPWFGSETLEQALRFCQQLPPALTLADIAAIPAELPACQFGFESAVEATLSQTDQDMATHLLDCTPDPLPLLQPHSFAALLPTGAAALTAWQSLWAEGYRTFKWKIGVREIAEELDVLHHLCALLPTSARLRLDANGGLSQQTAACWLRECDRIPQIEFLEQPLSPDQFVAMLNLAHNHATPLALDESVASLQSLASCYQQGWRGVVVVKPAIVGSPRQLRQICQTYPLDLVFSSALETAIGAWAGQQLGKALGNPDRAMGYGTAHWFADGWSQFTPEQFAQLWFIAHSKREHLTHFPESRHSTDLPTDDR